MKGLPLSFVRSLAMSAPHTFTRVSSLRARMIRIDANQLPPGVQFNLQELQDKNREFAWIPYDEDGKATVLVTDGLIEHGWLVIKD